MHNRRILIIGAGHIGTMVALHHALKKQTVYLWDTNPTLRKRWRLRKWSPYDYEIKSAAKIRKIKKFWPKMVSSISELKKIDTVIICVGTPANNFGYDYSSIKKAISVAIKLVSKNGGGNIVIRSTLAPGTCSDILMPFIRSKKMFDKINLIYFPEFSREGSALADFWTAESHTIAFKGLVSKNAVSKILGVPSWKLITVSFETAEMLKVTSNIWHALKVCFANEIGRAAAAVGADTDLLMNIFSSETKLNISAAYLRPGFPFGGPCLKKDIIGSLATFREKDAQLRLLSSILLSNEDHLNFTYEYILKNSPPSSSIGIIGTSFKPLTSDKRNSQVIELIYKLKKHYKMQCIEGGSPAELKKFAAKHTVVLLGAVKLTATAIETLKQSNSKLIDLRLNFEHFENFVGCSNYYRVI